MENITKKNKGKSVTQVQKEYLLSYLEMNLEIAHDRFVSADGAHERNNAWKSLAKDLNALGGASKTDEQWRKTWGDLKRNSKKKYGELKEAENRSGINGLAKIKQLSQLEQRVVQIMSERNVEGDCAVFEIGNDSTDIDGAVLKQLLQEENEELFDEEAKPSTFSAAQVVQPSTSTAVRQVEARLPPTTPAIRRPRRRRTPLLPKNENSFLQLEQKNIDIKAERLKLEERKVVALEGIGKSLCELIDLIKNKQIDL